MRKKGQEIIEINDEGHCHGQGQMERGTEIIPLSRRLPFRAIGIIMGCNMITGTKKIILQVDAG